jgi:hypothetical protein
MDNWQTEEPTEEDFLPTGSIEAIDVATNHTQELVQSEWEKIKTQFTHWRKITPPQ